MTVGCTCVSMWFGVVPPPPCPLHSANCARPVIVSDGTFAPFPEYMLSDENVKRIAASVAEQMRALPTRAPKMVKMVDGWPRRARVDLATPAEAAICAARDAVEAAGADPRLTKAVNLLGQALDAVADFVDGVES